MSRECRASVERSKRLAAKMVVHTDEPEDHSLHRLVRPFQHGNTSQWPERQRIRSALENIHDAADEASRCLEMDERLHERLDQASQAIRELEVAVHSLWPNRELSHGAKS